MNDFASRLIAWQKKHGRHDLPWQKTQDPYAIWVSEIMLQQTQVSAVISYYQRFMRRFPDIAGLAGATQEEVLQYWSGLGYYSRARNLHHAAQIIVDEHAGSFPGNFDDIINLPGIGRSTAAAISTFAFQQPQPILDGNVKRVFSRYFAIDDWPGLPKVEKKMWTLAGQLLPATDTGIYIQAQMDLGATVCTRIKPGCGACPLSRSCRAYGENRVAVLPAPRPRKVIQKKETTMLILLRGSEVMLERRPPAGVWGGLWSLPEISVNEDPVQTVWQRFGIQTESGQPTKAMNHTFTHFKLRIQPQPMWVIKVGPQARENGVIWLEIGDAIGAALPAPIRKILLDINRKAA